MSRDLFSQLSAEENILWQNALSSISPDDGKYWKASKRLKPYLSAAAEWLACVEVQRALLKTRVEFGQAEEENLEELNAAIKKINPVNISLLEEQVTRHDQLAVLEELGRFTSPKTKALLHPGTTSYDILDTARAYLFKGAWFDVMRLEVVRGIEKLCELSEKAMDILQVGRTHLQDTSPVPFGTTLASYAARLAERTERNDAAFKSLRGKISGIVGTGASIDMVIGNGESLDFEKAVLRKLNLEPDYTATQIVQKERLADVGHSLVTLTHVLGDFANDMRMLYSSAIGEVTSRDNAARLGGSSADATKNNPIDWENIAGKTAVVESGMRVLYAMIQSDLQRDLRGSVQARYQPNQMMAETYESFSRLNKALPQLSVNEDRMRDNLFPVRNNPSEAMVAILRGEPDWVHSQHGLGHDFVKAIGKTAKRTGKPLLTVALDDAEFSRLYETLPNEKKAILEGKIGSYIGSANERADINRKYARSVVGS